MSRKLCASTYSIFRPKLYRGRGEAHVKNLGNFRKKWFSFSVSTNMSLSERDPIRANRKYHQCLPSTALLEFSDNFFAVIYIIC